VSDAQLVGECLLALTTYDRGFAALGGEDYPSRPGAALHLDGGSIFFDMTITRATVVRVVYPVRCEPIRSKRRTIKRS
jgi:hypothetical protein